MLKLIEPAEEYARQIAVYRKAFLDSGDSMDGTDGLRRMEDPKEWVEHCRRSKDPDKVPEGRVPATQYMLVREDDDKIVGMIQIRHLLNEYLAEYGGHIGYSVAPDERRKGYASHMLKSVLPLCRELGIGRVLITCIEGNEGSRRTILRNGGVYENTVFESDMKVHLERYWIDLS